jgi:hypothetical protein
MPERIFPYVSSNPFDQRSSDWPVVGTALGRPAPPGFGWSGEPESPPVRWREHWHEHDQLLTLSQHDGHAAIYLDEDVDRRGTQWLLGYLSRTWQYVKATYGDAFGSDPRLYSIHHGRRRSGGHPGYHRDASHDYRNVSDCGPGSWREGDGLFYDLPSHEIAHVVESVNNDTHGSPAFHIWGDSKWAEFFQYDLYVALDMHQEAHRVYRSFTDTTDDFPRAGTHWFRDWFYPLWSDGGRAGVLADFFRLLATHFPTDHESRYRRGLNWGEYVHFTSCAAGTDLRGMATRAFGWPDEWSAQLERARTDFPLLTY